MSRPFAKIFDHPERGQMLVMLDSDDEGNPSISFSASLDEWGLGVCRVAVGFPDSDEGWAKADAAFAGIDYDAAVKACNALWQMADDPALKDS